MADIIGPEEREKSLYLAQIRYLDEQLERCQLQCDELEKQNNDLIAQYKALEEENKDIAEYLKHCLDAIDKKVEQRAEQLMSQQAVEEDREALKLQHSQQMQELQERLSELSMKQAAMTEEQKEELRLLKESTESMESLKKELLSQEEKNEAVIRSMMEETQFEMEMMFEEMKKTMADYVEAQTSDIVQEERAQHREQLEELELPLKENSSLWKTRRYLRMRKEYTCFDIEDLVEDFNKNGEECVAHMKEVDQLRRRYQQLDMKIRKYNIMHESMVVKEEDLSQALASVTEECGRKTAEISRLVVEVPEQRKRRRWLEVVVHDAAIILRQILMDSEKASNTRWELRDLLVVLESITQQGTSSAPDASTDESSPGEKPQTPGPGPARAATQDIPTDPLFLLVRYRRGDLGFVPRPAWKHKRTVSAGTQLLLNSQKTMTSVDPAPPPTPPTPPAPPAPQKTDSEAGASTSAGC